MTSFEEYLEQDGRKLSAEQLEVVYSNVATIVGAGAGSGKTTVLSYRFLRLLMQHMAKVDEILALTFTRKAASEMYERIFRIVEKVGRQNPDLQAQLKDFASSHISTLDSFASEIARTDCARYGISRDFQVLDQDDEEALMDRIAYSFADSGDADMLLLAKLFPPSRLSGLFLDVAGHVDILSSTDEEGYRMGYRGFLERLDEALRSEVVSAMSGLAAYDVEGVREKDVFCRSSSSCYLNVIDAVKKGETEGLRMSYPLRPYTGKPFGRSEWTAVKDILRKYESLMKILVPVRRNLADDVLCDAVSRIFSSFVHRLQSEKRRLGVLSFSDVESLCLRILKENRDVRSYYKRKFRYIMIDEFQDNSARQRDLLFILSEKENVSGLGVPAKEDLDNSKLFLVGDDKQSIYAFRGADVSVFNALKKDIVAIGGRYLTMSTNYRSDPKLLKHFNFVFSSILTRHEIADPLENFEEDFMSRLLCRNDLAGYEALFEPIGWPEGKKCAGSRIVFAHTEDADVEEEGDEADEEGDLLSSAENEAEFIRNLVEEMVTGDGYLVPDGKGGLRRPGYDDIAVLFQKSASQMPLEKTFRRAKIPYTVVSSTSITLEALSSDFAAYLSLLLFPEDKVGYFQVLRSPFVRLSDEALTFYLRYRDCYVLPEGERAFEFIPGNLGIRDRKKFEAAAELYAKLRAMLGRSTLTALLDTLYYESGYASFLKSSLSLSSYEEHYQYLWETAREMDSLDEFVSYISARLAEAEKLDIDLLRLRSDGVQLMTIHKAKGLEFPIVILAGTASWRSRPDNSRVVAYDGSPFIALDVSEDAGVNTVFRHFTSRRLEAERRRLLYVALTRAETHLVVVASGKRTKSRGYGYPERSMANLYFRALEGDDLHEERTFPSLVEDDIESARDEISSFEEFYDREAEADGVYTERKFGAKALAHLDYVSETESLQGEELGGLSEKAEDLIRTNGLASDFGTLVHGTLEAFFRSDVPPSMVSEKLEAKDCRVLEAEAAKIRDRFLSSSLYLDHVEGRQVLPEEGFFSISGGRVIEGSIDLLVLGNDYNLVIDYKTDRFHAPMDHRGQLLSYIEAVERIYGGKPCYAVLYYVRSASAEAPIDRDGNVVDLPD